MIIRDEKMDELVIQYRELRKKAKNATNEEEKQHYNKLAEEKHTEMLIYGAEGDKNIGRFNKW